MIEECIAFSAEPGHDYTNLRGQVLPFIRIRELFSVPGKPAKGENIVVLKHAGLGQMFAQSRCISGSTILGSGDVALILDVPQLVRQAMAKGGQGQPEHAALA